MTIQEEKSLYERLGGYDAIAAVTDDFVARLFSDSSIGDYWKGQSDDHKRKERQLIVDFFCEATGGPTFYTGRDMKTSHLGLGISESEYDTLMEHCVATLDRFEVPEREKGEVCSFIESFRKDIVTRDPAH